MVRLLLLLLARLMGIIVLHAVVSQRRLSSSIMHVGGRLLWYGGMAADTAQRDSTVTPR